MDLYFSRKSDDPVFLAFVAVNVDNIRNHARRTLNTESGTVDGKMVIIKFPPFSAGVEVIIADPALIGFIDQVNCLTALHFVPLADPADARLHIGVNKTADPSFVIPEYVVGTSADEDTVTLLGGFFDNLGLRDEKLIIDRHINAEIPRAVK